MASITIIKSYYINGKREEAKINLAEWSLPFMYIGQRGLLALGDTIYVFRVKYLNPSRADLFRANSAILGKELFKVVSSNFNLIDLPISYEANRLSLDFDLRAVIDSIISYAKVSNEVDFAKAIAEDIYEKYGTKPRNINDKLMPYLDILPEFMLDDNLKEVKKDKQDGKINTLREQVSSLPIHDVRDYFAYNATTSTIR